ncbi:MAG TPA: hypothetical protein VMU81_13170 [Acetobacteraceae bacterium]|nr:hypothetical protein [Acetobacteraceae bacterium]
MPVQIVATAIKPANRGKSAALNVNNRVIPVPAPIEVGGPPWRAIGDAEGLNLGGQHVGW